MSALEALNMFSSHMNECATNCHARTVTHIIPLFFFTHRTVPFAMVINREKCLFTSHSKQHLLGVDHEGVVWFSSV